MEAEASVQLGLALGRAKPSYVVEVSDRELRGGVDIGEGVDGAEL